MTKSLSSFPRPAALQGLNCLSVLLGYLTILALSVNASELRLAVHLPFLSVENVPNVPDIVNAIKLVEPGLNQLHPNHTFSVNYVATNLSLADSSRAFLDSVTKRGVLGIIGDYYSSYTEPQALTATYYKTYMCSGSAEAESLSDGDYRYFYRTIQDAPAHGVALLRFVKAMGWDRVNLVFHSGSRSVADGFTWYAPDYNVTISTTQIFSTESRDFQSITANMWSTGTLIHVLCADPKNAVDFISAAKDAGLIGAGNVWITPMAFSSAFDASNKTEWYDALEGFIYASPLEDTGNQYATEMKELWNRQYPGRKFPTYGMLYRDCMYSMAEGLLKLVDRHGYDRVLARNYTFNLFNLVRTFTGASGAITLDNWGDRQQDFVFKNIWNGTVRDTYLLPVESTSLLELDEPLRFPGGLTVKPIDHVPKVLINELWGTIGGAILGGFTVLLMAVIAGTIVYLIIHRNVPQVKHLSLPFLCVICFGCLLALTSTVLSLFLPSSTYLCQTNAWIFNFGFELVIGAGILKTYRIASIFANKSLAKLSAIQNKHLFAGLAFILTIQSVIMGVFTALSPMQPSSISGRDWIFMTCSSQHSHWEIPIIVTNLVYNGILMVIFMYLAFKTRRVSSNYRESKFMYVTGQSVAMSSIVVIVFSLFKFGREGPTAFMVKHWLIFMTVALAFYCLVGRIVVDVRAEANRVSNVLATNNTGGNLLRGSDRPQSCLASFDIPLPSGKQSSHAVLTEVRGPGSATLKSVLAVRQAGWFTRWESCKVYIFAGDGLLSMIPDSPGSTLGRTLDLTMALVDSKPAANVNCIEVIGEGSSWVIQFDSDQDRQKWADELTSIATLTNSTSRGIISSKSGARTGNSSQGEKNGGSGKKEPKRFKSLKSSAMLSEANGGEAGTNMSSLPNAPNGRKPSMSTEQDQDSDGRGQSK